MDLIACKECRVLLAGKSAAYNMVTGEYMCGACADVVLGKKPHVIEAQYMETKGGYSYISDALKFQQGVIVTSRAICDCPKPQSHGKYQTT